MSRLCASIAEIDSNTSPSMQRDAIGAARATNRPNSADPDDAALLRGSRSRRLSRRPDQARLGKARGLPVGSGVGRLRGGRLLLRAVGLHSCLCPYGRERALGLQCEGGQVLAAALCPHRSGLLPGAPARLADPHPGRGAVAGVGLVGGVRHGVGDALRAGVVAGLHDALELPRLVVVGGMPRSTRSSPGWRARSRAGPPWRCLWEATPSSC